MYSLGRVGCSKLARPPAWVHSIYTMYPGVLQQDEATMHLGAFCEASAPDTRARAARRAERGERRARGKSTLLHAKLNEDNQLCDAT